MPIQISDVRLQRRRDGNLVIGPFLARRLPNRYWAIEENGEVLKQVRNSTEFKAWYVDRMNAANASAQREFDLDAIYQGVLPMLAGAVTDEIKEAAIAEVEAIIATAAEKASAEFSAKMAPREIIVTEPTKGTSLSVGMQHVMFPTLLRAVSARANVYLYGPSGTGKTTAGEMIAKALGLSFWPQSMGPTTTVVDLLGYMDAGGNFVPGLLYRPFKDGGLALLDEMDAAHPSVLVVINTLADNGYCAFPNGEVVARHPDFVLLAAGNTRGQGASRSHVARVKMDAATLDRFSKIPWNYDENLEMALMQSTIGGLKAAKRKALEPTLLAWQEYVWKVRRAITLTGVEMEASTRSIVRGAHLIIAGFSLEEAAALRFWNGVSADDAAKVQANID